MKRQIISLSVICITCTLVWLSIWAEVQWDGHGCVVAVVARCGVTLHSSTRITTNGLPSRWLKVLCKRKRKVSNMSLIFCTTVMFIQRRVFSRNAISWRFSWGLFWFDRLTWVSILVATRGEVSGVVINWLSDDHWLATANLFVVSLALGMLMV